MNYYYKTVSMTSEDRTRSLLRELDRVEKRSEALRKETERLRAIKNEAKQAVAIKYPHLFKNITESEQPIKDSINNNLMHKNSHEETDDDDLERFSASAMSTTEDSIKLGSDGNDDDDLGLDRMAMSKDLQQVYEMLVAFGKRDASSGPEASSDASRLRKHAWEQQLRDPTFKRPHVPGSMVMQAEYQPYSGPLSEMLVAYNIQKENVQPRPEGHHSQLSQGPVVMPHQHQQQPLYMQPQQQPPYGFYIPMPVDYDTYLQWARTQQPVLHGGQMVQQPPPACVKPAAGAAAAPAVPATAEDGDGEDTSHDAADLVSQDSKEKSDKDKVGQLKTIGHPDRTPEAAKVSVESDEDEEEERDENFVIESDNIDEKLYSSESDSPQQPQRQKQEAIPQESTTTDDEEEEDEDETEDEKVEPKVHHNVKKQEASKPNKFQLNLQSESDTNSAKKVAVGDNNAAEYDISGPEMDDDDFWN